MPTLLDLPEKLRRQIFAHVLPENIAIDIGSPFKAKHALFHVSTVIENDAWATFATINKFYHWVYGMEIDDEKPEISLPRRAFLSHITRLHLIIRARTLVAISASHGTARLVLDGARLAKWIGNFERLELLVIGIPKVATPEKINEDLLMRFLKHVRTAALVLVDGNMSEIGKSQLQKTITTSEVKQFI
ncbi:hypothetical protein EV356DRAFT_150181 [Viridothelium virens]|uniref:Uncharacterized protein n=1 Tax=Viridothelium virens TaxID=1048519 RepID=A0A6A6H9I6_VIRVR|nr:hypothetical protein EV356DRAFT_150181 [Viridothelium virens]